MRPLRPPRRLRLHRETVRSLSASEMAGVAGGTVDYTGDDVMPLEIRPRSNAWTAGIVVAGLCEVVK